MKTIKNVTSIIILSIIFFTDAYAFRVGGARQYCKNPQFKNFYPPKKIKDQSFVEVAPESEISMIVTGSVDPYSIRVSAKKIPLKPIVVNKNSFYKVTAKLPAELRDGFARIDLIAQADNKECVGKDGWLIKLKSSE